MPFWPFRREKVRRKVVVGLGNPGAEYAQTRHNVGYWVLDALALAHGIAVCRDRLASTCGEGEIEGVPVLLAKPLTYMNNSGRAVAKLMDYARAGPESVLVICDDFALDLGKIRLRGGSSGGHRGLQDIVERIGSQDFPRLRFGIGPLPADVDAYDFVLSPFKPAERKLVEDRVIEAAQAAAMVVTKSIEEAMNVFN